MKIMEYCTENQPICLECVRLWYIVCLQNIFIIDSTFSRIILVHRTLLERFSEQILAFLFTVELFTITQNAVFQDNKYDGLR